MKLEAMRVKPKMQWRLKDIGDARNMERKLQKTSGTSPRERIWVKNCSHRDRVP
jgi:hypothetical protein